jgi:hypothetical protein
MTLFLTGLLIGFLFGLAAQKLAPAWRRIWHSRIENIPLNRGEKSGDLQVRR